MSKLSLRLIALICVFCTMAAVATPTDTFTTLTSFDGSNGANLSFVGLVQGLNGNLYGTTNGGGANASGTVFEITPGGTLTTLYSFCSQTNCTDGTTPEAGLVLAANGNFYGTTAYGGTNNSGTVFEITPAGKLATLYSFGSQAGDGIEPFEGLVQAANGKFYGMTPYGGANSYGTVFEITRAGKLTTLYSFGSQVDDGFYPYAGLVQAANGNFYGTTLGGGAVGYGTVFQITPEGKLTTLYSFCAQAGCTDGIEPYAGLVQATDGNFYGTTYLYGAHGYGTVFEITRAGKLTTLYSFCSQSSCTDGSEPYAGLVQATTGNFYGTTFAGGVNDDGTVFRLATGLAPFIATLPSSGKVGTAVKILGNDLTGATSVTFNGTSAAFTVVSSTEITTTVPSGATTGKVTVTAPSATLTSNVRFRVRRRWRAS